MPANLAGARAVHRRGFIDTRTLCGQPVRWMVPVGGTVSVTCKRCLLVLHARAAARRAS